MITEDYVSFETAKLLKEKGFNKDTYTMSMYDENGEAKDVLLLKVGEEPVLRPTLQMVMKWLREVHNIYIQIMLDSWALGDHSGYYIVIQKTDSDFEEVSPVDIDEVFFQTYEEACETGIRYCLEKMI